MTEPEFPEGTPEYERYRTALVAELRPWATGEPPYEYLPAIVVRALAETTKRDPLGYATIVDRIRADWETGELRFHAALARIIEYTSVTMDGAEDLLFASSTAYLADDRGLI